MRQSIFAHLLWIFFGLALVLIYAANIHYIKKLKPIAGLIMPPPRGTPVYASGDGKVIEAGYSKANGNFVF